MKKTLIAATVAALFAAPALASSMTIEFAGDDGSTLTVVFDQTAGTATMGDITSPYTYDEATKTICSTTPDGDACATFETTADVPAVGDTSAYTTNSGASGTATITALEE